jgi:SAM-dependent methyltransferase
MASHTFPFDLFAAAGFPGTVGGLIDRVGGLSMFPPYPWGHWTYAHVFRSRCLELPGDVLEAGVGNGGMSLFLALLLQELGHERRVFGVDTFEGLPTPDGSKDNPYFREGLYGPDGPYSDPLVRLFAGSDCPALDSLLMRVTEFGVADRITLVKGLFENVLPDVAPDTTFSFVHIDGDLFDSVYSALKCIWPRVDDGGIVAIDDFFHPGQGPIRAAAQFFNEQRITPLYNVVFPYSVFVSKEDQGRLARGVDGNAYSLERLREDFFFAEALERSLDHAHGDQRAEHDCRLLIDLLHRPASDGDIYDYWRALSRFWSKIDTRPEEWAISSDATPA